MWEPKVVPIDAANITSGTIATARLGSGTADATTFLRGDQTYAAPSAGGVPAGLITFVITGSCPTGWSEVAALNGKTLFGTIAVNADVGTTGGNDNITPAGTNTTPTFTGTAWTPPVISWPAGVPTISGIAVSDHASHTHTYTDVVNHVHVQNKPSGFTGGSAYLTADTSVNGSTASYLSTADPTGGVATGTTAGPGAVLTHTVSSQGTIAWPVGVPTIASYTPAGTNSTPVFTGSSFDNRSAFTKVIFCSKD